MIERPRRWLIRCFNVLLLVPLLASSCGGAAGDEDFQLADVVVTEVMSDNTRSIKDDFDEHSDWIEITNRGNRPVNLRGYGLSDDAKDRFKWTFPYLVLPPDGRKIVFASRRDRRVAARPLHTNFRVSASGESILLTTPSGTLADQTPPARLLPNVSFGRQEASPSGDDLGSGSRKWLYFYEPSPGEPNLARGWERLDAATPEGLSVNELAVNPLGGHLDEDNDASDWIELYNSGNEPVDLEGLALSDDLRIPFRWTFPARSLEPGAYLVVFASGKDRKGETLHTNFRMKQGESVGLFDRQGTLIQVVSTKGGRRVAALGRLGDDWARFYVASPGHENHGGFIDPDVREKRDQRLVINETMSQSKGNRLRHDWVEIQNRSGEKLNLKGYGLSDDLDRPFRWRMPTHVIQPDGLVLILLSGKSCSPPTCERIHADFRLGSQGETLVLTDPEGVRLDSFSSGQLGPGVSRGRRSGDDTRVLFDKPTPGRPNKGDGYSGYAAQPILSLTPPVDGKVTVKLVGDVADRRTHLQFGGSLPNRRSKQLTEPLVIEEPTVLRLRSYREGGLPSKVVTRSVFPGLVHDVPTVAVTVDPDQMFNPRYGLHSIGEKAKPEFPYKGANFWSRSELAAHFEFYSKDGLLLFDAPVGLQIFGNWSRGLPKKSFRLEARPEYGTPALNFPFFGREDELGLDEVVLRSGGQDSPKAVIRDVLATELTRDLNLDKRRYRPVALYINAEFWGFYHLREPLGAKTLAVAWGLDPEQLIVVNGWIGNRPRAFSEVRRYVRKNDPKSPEALAWVESKVELASFTDWLLMQLFLDNLDAGNCSYWKTKALDSRWRWTFYDLDLGMIRSGNLTFDRFLEPESRSLPLDVSELYHWLIQNPAFEARFLERASTLYREVMSPDRALALLDRFEEQYSGEMEKDEVRWKRKRPWAKDLESLRNFFRRRPATLRAQLQSHYRLSAEERDRLFPEFEGD